MNRFDEDPEDGTEIVFETDAEGHTVAVDQGDSDWTGDPQ